ncbi:ribbon-helix-helix domain-containing protein [Hydrogenophaga sp.]|jgi:predicted DNA-binding ribbon-helix-helix protein|uniref:ribbon-helix-helix domain-containing protein n=1 Tax=Hydrogenophaga sp. TaxID=1904254 RepID=UPI00272F1EA9|nr:ribbon-helix-helix domain-containing protein [Hydrogenophaga sp.]MDP1686215.1 ribbon-helix-helix domain-containing protein [Hydrogenophaga sp.]
MCEFFVKADPIQYEQRSRTVRMHGVLTSIRLENMVWDLLAEMAEDESCTTNALIAQFHDEILAHRGEVPNFASFLRVTCMRYMRRRMMALERQQAESRTPALQVAASEALTTPLQGTGTDGPAMPRPLFSPVVSPIRAR